jgi:hypothetical protein
MVLYSEDEWRRRSDLRRGHHIRFQMVVVMMSLSLPVLIISSMVLLPWTRRDPIILALLVVSLGTVVGIIIFSRMMIRRFDEGPLMGLYERGVQIDHEEFYPYGQIDGVGRGEDGSGLWLRTRGEDPTRRWKSRGWVSTVLGEEGVEELQRRVDGPRWTE